MAHSLSDVAESSYKRAMNIMRTEAGRVQSVTRQKSMAEADKRGIEFEKVWSSALDTRTRDSHRVLDGQAVKPDAYFKVNGHRTLQPHMFGIATEDINCRCRTFSRIKGYGPTHRRENETGEIIPYETYDEWEKGRSGQLIPNDSEVAQSIRDIYKRSDGNRKNLAENLLKFAGVNAKVRVKKIDARGDNTFSGFGKGNRTSINEFVLQSNDDRSKLYQMKTVFHEGYHSRLHGLEVPISDKFDMKKWTAIEETMTETAAQYQMSLVENDKIMSAYANYLSVNLPRMKRLQEFSNCNNLIDFGKEAMKYRFNEEKTSGDWRELYNKIDEVEFDFYEYTRDNYLEDIASKKDKILEMIYGNSPIYRVHDELIRHDLDRFVTAIKNGHSLQGNEEMIGKQALVALYRLVGVK